MKKFFDISPAIGVATAVFPGDQPFSRHIALDFRRGDHLLLSSFASTPHIGAHADGPNHYHADGVGIDQRPLELYFGRCQVIECRPPPAARIQISHLQGKSILAPRVIFKTLSFPDPESWNSDFNSLSPELIDFVAAHGVKLVGLDTPSVDPETSKELESHRRIYQHDLAILEGLVLEAVPEGLYTLFALPLKIKDGDASPVRAVLFQDPDLFAAWE